MSKTISNLLSSLDPLENDLAVVLLAWQEYKRKAGKHPGLGYEPRDINKFGAVELISRRVIAGSSGFSEVSTSGESYEALVDRYPERFGQDVVTKARERLRENELITPTANLEEYERREAALLSNPKLASSSPEGTAAPEKVQSSGTSFERSPLVGAWVKSQAKGLCDLCGSEAPFLDRFGQPFLETHHVIPLYSGGSDEVSNTCALCPNCHRAVHYASDRDSLTERIYDNVPRLQRRG